MEENTLDSHLNASFNTTLCCITDDEVVKHGYLRWSRVANRYHNK
jgi:hypothetical protein